MFRNAFVVSFFLGVFATKVLGVADETHNDSAPRVRIPLRMVPYAEVVTKNNNGASKIGFHPGREMTHTLRARIESANHFYFAGWHVHSIPVSWQRDTLRYVVQLDVYRQYGVDSSLEEKIGSMKVAGYLKPNEDKVYSFVANASNVFKNPSGEPLLSFAVGQNPAKAAEKLRVARQ